MTDMDLAALCKIRGINRVWIIDDAYGIKLPDADAIDSFIARVEQGEHFDAVADILGVHTAEIVDAGSFRSLVAAGDNAGILYARRHRTDDLGDALRELFAESELSRSVGALELAPLENFIKTHLELEPETWSDCESIKAQQPSASLIFIDYRLDADPNVAQDEAIGKSIKLVKSIYGRVPETSDGTENSKPIIVLITNLELSLEHQQAFRDRAEIPGAKFRFIPKSKFSDACRLQLVLFQLINHVQQAYLLEQFATQLKDALPKAQEEALRTITALDWSDYAYLHRFRLTKEGAALPAYILWLLGMFLQRQLEENEGLRQAASHLAALEEELANGAIPPAHFEPSEKIACLYQSAIYEWVAPINDKTPLSCLSDLRQRDAVIGMGDIFVPPDSSGRPIVVISQSCDIARPELSTTLLFLCGSVIRRDSERDVEKAHDDKMQSLLFFYPLNHDNHDGDHIIKWDLKNPLAYTIETFHKEVLCNGGYTRAWRLRTGYALKLQQEFAASLTRVGTPASPPYYRGLSGSVQIQTSSGDWQELFAFDEESRLVYDLSGRMPEKMKSSSKSDYGFRAVFLDAFVEKLRGCLSNVSGFPLKEANRRILRDFANDPNKLVGLLGTVLMKGSPIGLDKILAISDKCPDKGKYNNFPIVIALAHSRQDKTDDS
jgi:hypothetical protein